jgi:hypothetical protein
MKIIKDATTKYGETLVLGDFLRLEEDVDGRMLIRATGANGTGINLDDLADVIISSPVVNQFVRYNGSNWVNVVITSGNLPSQGNYLRLDGSTPMAGTLNMQSYQITWNNSIGTALDLNNGDIIRANSLSFADPGINEGLSWAGGSGWKFFESPDNLANTGGNLQVVLSGTRIAAWDILGGYTVLTGPILVGNATAPVTTGQDEFVATDGTRQALVGVDTTRGLFGMRSNHEFSLLTNNTRRWTVDANGHLLAVTDNTIDVGAAGATRPRTGYFASSVIVNTDPGGSGVIRATGSLNITGVITQTGTSIEQDLKRTDGGVDSKTWNWFAQPTVLDGRILSDDRLSAAKWIRATRSAMTVSNIQFYTGADVLRWQFDSNGHFIAGTDNTYDIGATGATRPRAGYFADTIVVGTDPGGSTDVRVGQSIRAKEEIFSMIASGTQPPSSSAAVMFGTTSTQGNHRAGFSCNGYWNGATWVFQTDGANSGGQLLLGGVTGPGWEFYTIISSGVSTQNIPNSELALYKRLSITNSTIRVSNISDLSPSVAAGAALGTSSLIWGNAFTRALSIYDTSNVLRATIGESSTATGMELGRTDGTAASAFIDFHTSTTNADYNARIIRQATDNAALQIVNSGTGNIEFWTDRNPRLLLNTSALIPNSSQLITLGDSTHTWGDVYIGTLGKFVANSAPQVDNILIYSGTSWVPKYFQPSFTAGQVIASSLLDGTSAAYVNDGRTPAGTPTAPTNIQDPVAYSHYRAIRVDMGLYGVLPSNQVFVVEYSINGGAYDTANAIVSTSSEIIHSNLNPVNVYKYRYKIRGATDSTYSDDSNSVSPSNNSEVNAFGVIIASQIATANLSAINANLGTIIAGQIQDAAINPKRVIAIGNVTDPDTVQGIENYMDLKGTTNYIRFGQTAKTLQASTNTSPITIISSGHGFTTGDTVTIRGHTVNTNANGTWPIIVLNNDQFNITNSTGSAVGPNTGSIIRLSLTISSGGSLSVYGQLRASEITDVLGQAKFSGYTILSGTTISRSWQSSSQGEYGDLTINRILIDGPNFDLIRSGTSNPFSAAYLGNYVVAIGATITARTTTNQGTSAGWVDPDGTNDGRTAITTTVNGTFFNLDTNRPYCIVGDPTAGTNVDAYDDLYTIKYKLRVIHSGTFSEQGCIGSCYIEYSTDGGVNWADTGAAPGILGGNLNQDTTATLVRTVTIVGSPTQLRFRLKLKIVQNGGSLSVAESQIYNVTYLTDNFPITWSTSSGNIQPRRGLKLPKTSNAIENNPHLYLEPLTGPISFNNTAMGEVWFINSGTTPHLEFNNGSWISRIRGAQFNAATKTEWLFLEGGSESQSPFTLVYDGTTPRFYMGFAGSTGAKIQLYARGTANGATAEFTSVTQIQAVGEFDSLGTIRRYSGNSLTLKATPTFEQNTDDSTTSTSAGTAISTIVIPANTLVGKTDSVRIRVTGEHSGASGSANVFVSFGATNLLASQAIGTGELFDIDAIVAHQTGASSQVGITHFMRGLTGAAIGSNQLTKSSPAESPSSNISVVVKGNIVTAGTLVIRSFSVEHLTNNI